jgi:protein-tyrosine phosphatase
LTSSPLNNVLPVSIPNFRDFAPAASNGIGLKKGLIFRSGYPEKLKKKDIQIVESMQFNTIIDLRSENEQAKNPDLLPARNKVSLPYNFDESVRIAIKPLLTKKNSEDVIISLLDSLYKDMTDGMMLQVNKVFDLLASPKAYPALIHCKGGKDRTGFICSILHLATGLHTNTIIDEYLLTNQYYLPRIAKVSRIIKVLSLGLMPVENFIASFAANEKYISSVIETINQEYGSIYHYLNECGVTEEKNNQVKKLIAHP